MAKNYVYKRNLTDKFTIKGVLSEDCQTIVYENSEGESAEIAVEKCLAPFAGEDITFVVTTKSDQEKTLDEE